MDTQLTAYIIGIAIISFAFGHGALHPLLKKKNIDSNLAMMIKHMVSFTLLFIIGTAVMIFMF